MLCYDSHMGNKIAHFLGNCLVFFTFIRALLGISLGTQNMLLGFGVTILLIFVIAFWETRSSTKGVARLKRGILFFITTIIIDVMALLILHVL